MYHNTNSCIIIYTNVCIDFTVTCNYLYVFVYNIYSVARVVNSSPRIWLCNKPIAQRADCTASLLCSEPIAQRAYCTASRLRSEPIVQRADCTARADCAASKANRIAQCRESLILAVAVHAQQVSIVPVLFTPRRLCERTRLPYARRTACYWCLIDEQTTSGM